MVCRSFAVALLIVISVLVPSKPAAAQTATGPPCAARNDVISFLRQVGQRLVGSGLSSDGLFIELYADLTGTWTIITTAPTGTSCLTARGQAWEAPIERVS